MSNRRNFLSLAVIAIAAMAVQPGRALAQQSPEAEAVKAANQAFYVALSGRDAKAMEALWAAKPYVVNIGPRSKAVTSGHADAVTKYWPVTFEAFSQLSVTATVAQVHVSGNIAYVVGAENGTGTLRGNPVKLENLYTNIFEKDGNKWLMISHHAQGIPQ